MAYLFKQLSGWLFVGVFLSPLEVYAQNFNNIDVAIARVGYWVGRIIPMLITLATLYFFWNAAQFVLHSSNEDEREKGKQGMIWGVVAVFCMVSFWGLVGFVSKTFDVGGAPADAVTPSVANLPP